MADIQTKIAWANPDGSRRTLVERATDNKFAAQSNPENAKRTVHAVESQHFHQQKNFRAKKDEAARLKYELKHIEDQVARLMVRYKPLCAQLEARKKQRDNLKRLLQKGISQTKELSGFTHTRHKASMSRESRLARKMAAEGLRAERGFSMLPGTTHSHTVHGGANERKNRRKLRMSRAGVSSTLNSVSLASPVPPARGS